MSQNPFFHMYQHLCHQASPAQPHLFASARGRSPCDPALARAQSAAQSEAGAVGGSEEAPAAHAWLHGPELERSATTVSGNENARQEESHSINSHTVFPSRNCTHQSRPQAAEPHHRNDFLHEQSGGLKEEERVLQGAVLSCRLSSLISSHVAPPGCCYSSHESVCKQPRP